MNTKQNSYDYLTYELKNHLGDLITKTDYLCPQQFKGQNGILRFISEKFEWRGTGEIIDIVNDGFTVNRRGYNYYMTRNFYVKGYFELVSGVGTQKSQCKEYDMEWVTWNNESEWSFEIRDIGLQVIKAYNEQVYNIYKEENLICLSAHHCSIAGLNPSAFWGEKTQGATYKRQDVKWYKQFQEVVTTSKDIKHCLGELMLYGKYLGRDLFQPFDFAEKIHYKMEIMEKHRRYFQLANKLYEKTYNFWDKIGDMIDIYVETKLKSRQVDFVKVIEALEKLYPNTLTNSPSFKWLHDFKNNEYKELNDVRKKIVHYHYLETEMSDKHLDNTSNGTVIKQLEEEFYGYRDYFKKHLELSIEGYKHALNVIEQYSNISPTIV